MIIDIHGLEGLQFKEQTQSPPAKIYQKAKKKVYFIEKKMYKEQNDLS